MATRCRHFTTSLVLIWTKAVYGSSNKRFESLKPDFKMTRHNSSCHYNSYFRFAHEIDDGESQKSGRIFYILNNYVQTPASFCSFSFFSNNKRLALTFFQFIDKYSIKFDCTRNVIFFLFWEGIFCKLGPVNNDNIVL